MLKHQPAHAGRSPRCLLQSPCRVRTTALRCAFRFFKETAPVKFLPLFAEGEAPAPAPDPGATGQPADPAAAPQQGGLFGGGIMSFAPIILLALFFLVVLLPAQRRQKREAAARLAKMKAGAKVVLNSGIVGKIVTIKDGEDEIVIKSDDTKLRVLRSAIATVVDETAPATTEPAKS